MVLKDTGLLSAAFSTFNIEILVRYFLDGWELDEGITFGEKKLTEL